MGNFYTPGNKFLKDGPKQVLLSRNARDDITVVDTRIKALAKKYSSNINTCFKYKYIITTYNLMLQI